jgi:hypothetical protein
MIVRPAGVCLACCAAGHAWDSPTEDGCCYQCHAPLQASPAPYPWRSRLRRGSDLVAADRAYVRARWGPVPDLQRSWWFTRADGRLDRRHAHWLTSDTVGEWRGCVEQAEKP